MGATRGFNEPQLSEEETKARRPLQTLSRPVALVRWHAGSELSSVARLLAPPRGKPRGLGKQAGGMWVLVPRPGGATVPGA